MELDILQNNFETVYKEYKDYKSYIESVESEIVSQRDAFKNRVASGKDDEDTLVSALFDLSIRPIQHQTDLKILRDRLISVFDAYKIILEFPEEIKEEIRNLIRPIQIYTISNGKEVELDKEKSDMFREEARRSHAELIKSLKTNTIPS